MSKVIQLDATKIKCPEFSLAARIFLNKLQDTDTGHIVTLEERAEKRLEHVCTVHGWSLNGPCHQDGLIHFVVNKTHRAECV